jgi:hypothetical protein
MNVVAARLIVCSGRPKTLTAPASCIHFVCLFQSSNQTKSAGPVPVNFQQVLSGHSAQNKDAVPAKVIPILRNGEAPNMAVAAFD